MATVCLATPDEVPQDIVVTLTLTVSHANLKRSLAMKQFVLASLVTLLLVAPMTFASGEVINIRGRAPNLGSFSPGTTFNAVPPRVARGRSWYYDATRLITDATNKLARKSAALLQAQRRQAL